MNLKNAELIIEEFNKLALVESAEVVANSEGEWSVRVTATFGDSSIAGKILGAARAEEDFGTGLAWPQDSDTSTSQGKPLSKYRVEIGRNKNKSPSVLLCMPESDNAQHKESVLPLAQCISKLPWLQKKVLAMYYFENMPLADTVTSLGLSEARACEILVETSARLFLVDRRTTAFNAFAGHSFPEVFRERLPGFLDNTGGSIWLRKMA